MVVFYHGGGFVLGSIATHAGLAAELSRALDLPVISVEYRLAPEHPWPAQLDDGEAAARWIAENGPAFARRFTGLVLCGDSAGGTVTVVTALALRDRPAALPLLAQLAIYPKVDFSRHYPSDALFAQGYGLDRSDMDYFTAAYRPDPQHRRGSPLLADQAGLPPTLVVTASLDPLRDNGRAYAAALAQAGVDVTYREFRGTIHGFCSFRAVIPSARDDPGRVLRAGAKELSSGGGPSWRFSPLHQLPTLAMLAQGFAGFETALLEQFDRNPVRRLDESPCDHRGAGG